MRAWGGSEGERRTCHISLSVGPIQPLPFSGQLLFQPRMFSSDVSLASRAHAVARGSDVLGAGCCTHYYLFLLFLFLVLSTFTSRPSCCPPRFSLFFLLPLLLLGLNPLACLRADVLALQKRVDRGILRLRFGHRPVQISKEALLSVGSEERTRVRCTKWVSWMSHGIWLEGCSFKLHDALSEQTATIGQGKDRRPKCDDTYVRS